jgi:hypothetical protein
LAADTGQIFQTFRLVIYSRSKAIWGEAFDPVIAKQAFIMVPYPMILRLAEAIKAPALAVLSELLWQSYSTKKTTFRSTSDLLERHTKQRGLAILEREKWVTVERGRGKSPLVTLRWLKQTCPSDAHNLPFRRT